MLVPHPASWGRACLGGAQAKVSELLFATKTSSTKARLLQRPQTFLYNVETHSPAPPAAPPRCHSQNNWQLNALAGLVSLLPATDPTVFSIRGGNQQLAPALAKKAGVGVLTSLDVESVALRSDGRFDVIPSADAATGAAAVSSGGCPCSADGAAEQQEAASDAQLPLQGLAAAAAGGVAPKGGDQQRRLVGQQHEEQQGLEARCRCRCAGAGAAASRTPAANPHPPLGPFDAVILATPLEGSSLTFLGFDPPRMPSRQYQTTITTLVRGAVRPEYFGIADEPAMPFSECLLLRVDVCVMRLGLGVGRSHPSLLHLRSQTHTPTNPDCSLPWQPRSWSPRAPRPPSAACPRWGRTVLACCTGFQLKRAGVAAAKQGSIPLLTVSTSWPRTPPPYPPPAGGPGSRWYRHLQALQRGAHPRGGAAAALPAGLHSAGQPRVEGLPQVRCGPHAGVCMCGGCAWGASSSTF